MTRRVAPLVTRKFLFALLATAILGDPLAAAQVYPSRPVTMIVPFAAGGPTDTIGRVVAEGMRGSLGQPVIIENITGAAGTLAVGRAARAAPDGYTLSLGAWPTHVVNGAVYTLPYDVLKDFEPVALIANNPELIVTKSALPANDLRGLIAWLKANPDKGTASSSGLGSASHVSGLLFQKLTDTRFQFVPYRGAGPAMQDLIAGQIDLMFDQASNSLPHLQAGAIRAIAVTSATRLTSAPEIPTVDEAGLPEFHVSIWHGLWVPKGTPSSIIRTLNSAVMVALATPEIRRRLTELGQEIPAPDQQTPEALGAFHKAEIDKWWPVIRAAGIKQE